MSAFEKGEEWAEECYHAGMPLDEILKIVENGEAFDKTAFDEGARAKIEELRAK